MPKAPCINILFHRRSRVVRVKYPKSALHNYLLYFTKEAELLGLITLKCEQMKKEKLDFYNKCHHLWGFRNSLCIKSLA